MELLIIRIILLVQIIILGLGKHLMQFMKGKENIMAVVEVEYKNNIIIMVLVIMQLFYLQVYQKLVVEP